jgi:hypothetical protein
MRKYTIGDVLFWISSGCVALIVDVEQVVPYGTKIGMMIKGERYDSYVTFIDVALEDGHCRHFKMT